MSKKKNVASRSNQEYTLDVCVRERVFPAEKGRHSGSMRGTFLPGPGYTLGKVLLLAGCVYFLLTVIFNESHFCSSDRIFSGCDFPSVMSGTLKP